MNEWALAGALFFVLCGAAALGSYVRARLPEKHRSAETMGLVQATISLLVTFTSIVLGLLTGAVATEFQQASRNDGAFAGQLVQVDQCLRDYGPETAQMREQFRGYVAAVLTSTWPNEPPPKDIPHPDVSNDPVLGEGVSLTALLNTIRTELRESFPQEPRSGAGPPIAQPNSLLFPRAAGTSLKKPPIRFLRLSMACCRSGW